MSPSWRPGIEAPPAAVQSPVVTSTIRTLTPLLVGAITYALAKANLGIDSTTVSVVVSSVLSVVVGGVYTFVVRWLESHKSSWWGKLFLIAKAPAYSSDPGPQPAPVVISNVIPVQTTPPGV